MPNNELTGPQPPAAQHALDLELSRVGLDFTPEQRSAFERHLDLLEDWNQRAGLTAIRDRDEVMRRLFGESLALLLSLRAGGVLEARHAARVADIGPGGGFPGVPMRIVDPSLQLVMIESQRRRCEFLEALITELELDGIEVVNARAEEAGRAQELRGSFDLVVARAVAPLAVLVEYALPLLKVGGVLATPKGSRASEERTDAVAAISALGGVALEPLTLSLPEGVPAQQVLLVRREGALDDRYPRRPGVPSKQPLR
jgi:16S rRNA (guanine527-N7)-methyltransferase